LKRRNTPAERNNPAAQSTVDFTPKLAYSNYSSDMEDYEKTQATIKLTTELAKGKKAGEEQGWLSVEEVKQDLGITHA
jgi:hypothetical protein